MTLQTHEANIFAQVYWEPSDHIKYAQTGGEDPHQGERKVVIETFLDNCVESIYYETLKTKPIRREFNCWHISSVFAIYF